MTRYCLVFALLVVPLVGRADEKDEKAKEDKALLQCKVLLQACEAYQLNAANNGAAPPLALVDLVKPPFAKNSYLPNGEKDLLDPWGKVFKYATVPDADGALQPYVWCERTVDGQTKVIGTKPPEKKKK